MAFANTEFNSLVMTKLNRVMESLASLRLAQTDEETAELDRQLKEARDDLKLSNVSAVELLQKAPRAAYDEFREPDFDQLSAETEFMRQKQEKLNEIQEAKDRIEKNEATPADLARTDLNMAQVYAYTTDCISRTIDNVSYLKNIDGSCDRTKPLRYEAAVDASLLVGCVKLDPKTNYLSLFESLTKIIHKASRIGLTHEGLDELFIIFVREYLPDSYGSVRRLTGKALFESILGLTNYHSMISDLISRLDNVERRPGQNIEVAVHAVQSLVTELLNLTIPDLSQTELTKKIDSVIKKILPRLLKRETRAQLATYARRVRTDLKTEMTLESKLAFINKIEISEKYQLDSVKRISKSDIPASLFHSKIVDERMVDDIDTEMDGPLHPEYGGSSVANELLLYGEAQTETRHNTRSSPAPLLPPLHSWGDTPGLAERRGEPGQAGGYQAQAREINVRAEVHQPATPTVPVVRDVQPPRPPSPAWRTPPRASPVPARTSQDGSGRRSGGERGRSPTRRPFQPNSPYRANSPGSSQNKLYRRTDSGNMRSVDRGSLYVYNDKKGFLPRSPSGPRHNFKTPAEAQRNNRCRRCFRYIGKEVTTEVCTDDRCLRYLRSHITTELCEVCQGGFHPPAVCSRRSRTTSPANRNPRPRSSSPGFNRNLSLNKKKVM